MPTVRLRQVAAAGLAVIGLGAGFGAEANAGRAPLKAEIATPEQRPFPPRGSGGHRGADGRLESKGWWLGTAGIALVLAAFGAVSLASRRYWPQGGGGPLRVVGRTSLTPKHQVFLLRAGGRVLIVGAGPQGPPSLLGELTDPDVLRGLESARDPATEPSGRPFDSSVGDET